MSIRVGLNGFGRVGRSILRAAKQTNAELNFVGINDLCNTQSLATVLKYDSVHGVYPGEISVEDDILTVDNDHIKILSEEDPSKLPWGDLDVDVVIEATGVFRQRKQLEQHLDAGASQVVLTVPAKDEIDATVVMGVNDNKLTGEEKIISNASCTTNCAAILAKVVNDAFGISHGYLITVHAYTMDQRLLDYPHRDMRRARSAALSIIPTSTGAAKSVGKVIPELDGKLDGMAYRVPIPDGSIVDLSLELEQGVTKEEVDKAFLEASATKLKGYLQYNEEPLVSVDIIGNRFSAIYDAPLTSVLRDDFIKISGWYDNESGYAMRVVDLTQKVVQLRKNR
ncbi:MAG: type I glyceraldehyde-3-phosphate dehydrogenase [Candidatus Marinimicrobia bacterium]|nr:type I glyceraldehyde-3-phosphate dehydrogenase [Candidatus Neomarinimicrobiota bacterium]MCF7829663.1 type I glyceraldehyde-3-phosphate dehydrogenase [Candidatus Neomarinimicrobiota bacterium]MCF7879823.1 type I glyceraldehyde-3-phosphate dehydrogenase [Candidatus Neomarinimicrobiota bacterium]